MPLIVWGVWWGMIPQLSESQSEALPIKLHTPYSFIGLQTENVHVHLRSTC